MKEIPLKRGTVTQFVETPELVVAVEVPVVYAPEESDEPLLEAETVKFLDEVTRRARAGDRQWLMSIGRVYEPIAQ